jgi:hypothetical protein
MMLLPSLAQAQFQLGLQDLRLQSMSSPTRNSAAFNVFSTIDGKFERIGINWYLTAPAALPTGFDGGNPASAGYTWTSLDAAIKLAAEHHKQVILAEVRAPSWALGPNHPTGPMSGDITGGAWDPNVTMFAQFIHALAVRYSGSFVSAASGRLPRVRYFEIWNEENISGYMAAPSNVTEYRKLLNAGYQAVKSVHADNKVIFGGMAGVGGYDPWSIPPLKFAAQVMCLRRVGQRFVPNGRCPVKAHFDILAEHPYAFASSPTKHAYQYDDLLVADMPKLRALLDTAKRLRTIRGDNQLLWATEFAWATNPPNTPIGDSPGTAARYVAYALYELWAAGVSTVIYAPAIDNPLTASTNLSESGTGLLNADLTPKLTLTALAFPFIASVGAKGGFAWGRVPVSHRVKVFVQHKTRRGWRTAQSVRTGPDGVFTAHFPAHGNGTYRAQVAHGQISLPYFSAKIPGKRLHLASPLLG